MKMCMKNCKSLSLAVCSFITAASFFTSCESDNVKSLDSRFVTLDVSAKSEIATKSSSNEVFETVDLSDLGLSLYLNGSASVNKSNPFFVNTKASELIKNDVDQFPIYMIGATSAYGIAMPGEKDYWSIFNNGNKVMWQDIECEGAQNAYDFFAYYPAEVSENIDSEAHSITYSGIDPSSDDATKMEDFLMALTTEFKHDHAAQNLVPLTFVHPLAAVRFSFDELDKNVTIEKVTINNVNSRGIATIEDEDTVDWSELSVPVDYSESDFTTVDNSTFFIIPQGLSNVSMTFLLKKDGVEYSFTTKVLGTDNWKPGFIYNYSLSSSPTGKVGIEIKEEFNGVIKSDVKVANVKTSAVYVRAAVVANWYNSADKVVAPFDGDVVTEADGWIKGDDGFWYYTSPVNGYDETNALIDSFKDEMDVPASPFKLHLVIDVVAQAVEYEDSKASVIAAWGTEVASKLMTIAN